MGPTWDPKGGRLYFVAAGREGLGTQLLRLESPGVATVWLDQAEGATGTCVSSDGRLLVAQSAAHRVVSYAIGPKGPRRSRILLEEPTLKQPNDLVQAANGNIYFTDPDFGGGGAGGVFLLRPKGGITRLISDMPQPNGLALSPDGRTLYVSDSQEKLCRSFPILPNGVTAPGGRFFSPEPGSPGEPDGMGTDERGNLYLAGMGGVWVVTPAGEALGFIPVKEFCTSLTFGGPDGRDLYLACNGRLYTLRMTVRGGFANQGVR